MTKRKLFFNEAASTWDERFNTPELAAFLEKIVPHFDLKPGDNVLDVGTGTGIVIPFLIQAIGPTGTLTTVDYAEKMVQITKSKYSHLKNVTIKLQDVEELDLSPESFDVITCFGLFPHLENKIKALDSMYRVLKHGGTLIIVHALSSAEIEAHHTKASPAVANDLLPKEPEMRRLLKHAGFEEVCIKDEPGCYLCVSTKP